MGKRTNFKRRARDFYPTPESAVIPLLPHLKRKTRFCEPCAGAGALIDQLTKHGHICARARDIHPRRADIEKNNALTTPTGNIDCFITNPPWDWKILSPLITFLSDQHPTWLLLNADLMHNRRMAMHMLRCVKVVSVGRVSWMANGVSGFENCAWYLFDSLHNKQTAFIARAA